MELGPDGAAAVTVNASIGSHSKALLEQVARVRTRCTVRLTADKRL